MIGAVQRRRRPEDKPSLEEPLRIVGTVPESSTKCEGPNITWGEEVGTGTPECSGRALGGVSQQKFHQKSWGLFGDDGGNGLVQSHHCGHFSTNKLLPADRWHQWILDREALLLSRLENITSPFWTLAFDRE